MQTKRRWVPWLLGWMLVGRIGCVATSSPNDASGSGAEPVKSEVGTVVAPHATSLWVHVVDQEEQTPLQDVTVLVGDRWRTTDALGNVFLDDLYPGQTVIGLRAKGFLRTAIGSTLDVGMHGGLVAPMKKRVTKFEPVNAATGGLKSWGDVGLDIPANAFVDEQGVAITGLVDVGVTYLDPMTNGLEAVAGGFDVTWPGNDVPAPHRAFVMADVFFAQNGSAVQLGQGKKVTLEIPLPSGINDMPMLGESIRIVSKNLMTGLWTQGELGTVQASSAPSGLSWKGDLSTSGLYAVAKPINAPGCVRVQGPAGVWVQVTSKKDGYTKGAFVGANGEVGVDAPVGATVDVSIAQAGDGATQSVDVTQDKSMGCVEVSFALASSCGEAGTVRTCATNDAGCAIGREVCDGLAGSVCSAEWFPRVEICNGLDDDCNGLVDDDVVDAGWPCQAAGADKCGRGVIVGCAAGKPICERIQFGLCPPLSCSNNLIDGPETDNDCGGPACYGCDVGGKCNAGSDCVSKVCSGKLCQTATCFDSIQNQDETDQDCGGTACSPCEPGKTCGKNPDCASNMCSNGFCN